MRSGPLDGAVVLVESIEEAQEMLVRYRARLRDSGWLWLVTRKRGHENYLNQMLIVPYAKKVGMIDNKTCSIDDERSGIRFVVPARAARPQRRHAPLAPPGFSGSSGRTVWLGRGPWSGADPPRPSPPPGRDAP